MQEVLINVHNSVEVVKANSIDAGHPIVVAKRAEGLFDDRPPPGDTPIAMRCEVLAHISTHTKRCEGPTIDISVEIP